MSSAPKSPGGSFRSSAVPDVKSTSRFSCSVDGTWVDGRRGRAGGRAGPGVGGGAALQRGCCATRVQQKLSPQGPANLPKPTLA